MSPRAAFIFAALVVAGCGESGPRARFEAEVAGVLEAGCTSAACHGVAPGAEADGEVIDWSLFFVRTDAVGRITDMDAAYASAKVAINTVEVAASSLLRKPLSPVWGGTPHLGGSDFLEPTDPGYQAIYAWIAAESGGGEDPGEPLDALEQQFADTVQPFLLARTCSNTNCHGVDAAVPFRLDPGVPGELPLAATRHNYAQARFMLALDGEAKQSRLLAKMLPLHAGGIVHKGGNGLVMDGLDDPAAQAILHWACAERLAAVGEPCRVEGAAPIRGVVFVRGPLDDSPPFQLDAFVPGTDLWLAQISGAAGEELSVGEPINLTASLHDGAADVRDPAVDPAGRAVVFAMRTSPDEGHRIMRLDLETLEATALTAAGAPLPGGGMWTDRDPTFAPDGHIWFASTRQGVTADAGQMLDAELYELDPVTGELTRRTWTPHIERKPVYLVTGEENGGEVAFSVRRDLVPAQARAHPFRFPPGLDTEYHQHFGITPPETLFWDLRELADGRYVVVLGELDHFGATGGGLGIIDRNFGPELNRPQPPSLPFYAAPLTRLDGGEGHFRDPVGLPDGSLLVASAPGGEDGVAAPQADLRIERLVLAESPAGGGPSIVARQVLIDAPGVADFDPEPVMTRYAGPPLGPPSWDPKATTGTFRHQGLPMIEALLANLEPAGLKRPRTDMRFARLVEAVPLPPVERAPIVAAETRDGQPGATSVSLGTHGVQRVLAELPLASDGSFHAEVPVGVSFHVQGLNAERMAVGTAHNRWYYLAPGQVMTQGVGDPATSSVYGMRCAGCHGAADGTPVGAFVTADVITTASLTLARYEDQDPRRPIEPTLVGAETRLEVDFQRDVQPILSRACAGCHQGAGAPGGLSLTDTKTQHFSDAYESLLAPGEGSDGGRRWVDEGNARASTSYLIEKITGREWEAPRVLDTPGVRHGELSTEEATVIIRWIDLGATFRGTGRAAP